MLFNHKPSDNNSNENLGDAMTSQDNHLQSQSYEELISTIRHMLQESERQSNRMMTMTNISAEMTRAIDFDSILAIVRRDAKWLIDFEHCSVTYSNVYGVWESSVLIDRKHTDIEVDISAPTLRQVINTSASCILDQPTPDFLPMYSHKLVIPLATDSQVIGTIQFARSSPFEDEDLRIGLFLAYQMASSIDKMTRLQILLMTQQQLADYAKELSVQNEEIETYNHTIAHDLKSPLSMILLKVGLIKMSEKNLDLQTVRHLGDISDRVRHMEEMIDQLLVLSQLRHDTQTMSSVDSNQVVERCLKRFPEIETGKVMIEVQSDMPSVVAHAQWLEEIFANLISNAIKYMGDQQSPLITISAKVEQKHFLFSVIDNGVGIRLDDQDQLFKKFSRLYEVQADGLGLGLSIVQRIVDSMGGDLGLESEYGKGTRFWFTVPMLSSEDPMDLQPV